MGTLLYLTIVNAQEEEVELVDVTADHDGNFTINEGEKSFIVFNLTYYGTVDTTPDLTIYTNKSPYTEGVPIGNTIAGSSLQYAWTPTNCDCDSGCHCRSRILISSFAALLIHGTEELNQSLIQCRYTLALSRDVMPCNISIWVTVTPANSEGKPNSSPHKVPLQQGSLDSLRKWHATPI